MKIKRIDRFPVGARESLWHPVCGSGAVVAGDADFDMVKVDAKTLKADWEIQAGGFEPLGVVGRRVVVGSYTQTAALDLQTGKQVWKRRATGGLWADRVLFSRKDVVEVVDTETGKSKGEIETGDSIDCIWPCGDTLVVQTVEDPNLFYAYSMTKRRILWSRPLLREMDERAGHGEASPGRVDITEREGESRFLAARGIDTFCCSLADGSILWHQTVRAPYRHLNWQEGRVYMWGAKGSWNPAAERPWNEVFGHFIVLDDKTGKVRVKRHYPEEQLQHTGGAGTFWRGHLLFATSDTYTNWIMAFRCSDGELVMKQKVRGLHAWPLVVDDRLFVSTGAELVVFDLEA